MCGLDGYNLWIKDHRADNSTKDELLLIKRDIKEISDRFNKITLATTNTIINEIDRIHIFDDVRTITKDAVIASVLITEITAFYMVGNMTLFKCDKSSFH